MFPNLDVGWRRLADPHRRGAGDPPPRDPGPPAAAKPRPYWEAYRNLILKINYIIPGVGLLPAILPVYITFWTEICSNIIGWVYIFCDVLSSNIVPLVDISNNQLIININKYIKY